MALRRYCSQIINIINATTISNSAYMMDFNFYSAAYLL